MQGLCPTRKRKKERKHHEQSHTPRTYHKVVPTCRGIKTDAAAGEGNLSNPLSLLRGTQGIKRSLHAVIFKNNGKRQTLLCGTREKMHSAAQHLCSNTNHKKIPTTAMLFIQDNGFRLFG